MAVPKVPSIIYKILTPLEWKQFGRIGKFSGSPKDIKDGFIHLSVAKELETSLNLYYNGQKVMILGISTMSDFSHGEIRMEWSKSRETYFPLLYGADIRANNILSVQEEMVP